MQRKKVLIISYYWPPAGGIGVLRCLKLAKYLRESGWEPVVYTAKDAHYPSYDPGNARDIPEGITILKQPLFEPYTFYKKFTGQKKEANANNALVASDGKRGLRHKISVFIRSNFFIPDARTFWIKPSVKYLVEYLTENPVDAIFSDGPPHSNTMIACMVKEQTGIPWLSDFQDPWTQVDYYQRLILMDWADRKHKRLEQRAFRMADAMTIVSPTWKRDLESIGARNVSVVVWGYDEDDFNDITPVPDRLLTLTHTGLMGEDRNPDQLFAVIRELADREPGFKEVFRLQLIGQVDGTVRESIEAAGISDMTVIIPQVLRKESLQYICNSQLLLLLLNKAENAMGRIPGKLFEYLAARRPILCMGPVGSDVDNIIAGAKAGSSAGYEDKASMKKLLAEYYRKFKEQQSLEASTGDISQYSNRNTTAKIASLLDGITKKL